MEIIGIDFGASYTRFGVVDEKGDILKKIFFTTPRRGSEIRKMFERGFNYIHKSGVSKKAPVGVATIGPLSIKKGMVVKTPNLGGLNINIRKLVEEFHNGPFTMLNDCTAAAWAEKTFGAGRKAENLVYVTLSTGIGGGAVVDNHLLIGKDGNAVEIGHLVVDAYSNVVCGCGGAGHWEALCSGTGLPKLAASIGIQPAWSTAPDIFEAAAKNDERAKAVLDKMAVYNAAGFASVINAFDPELLVVGGGLALSHPQETIFKPLRYLRKFRLLKAKIMLTSLGPDAPLLGAAAYASRMHES